jgi:hypothetical protein
MLKLWHVERTGYGGDDLDIRDLSDVEGDVSGE